MFKSFDSYYNKNYNDSLFLPNNSIRGIGSGCGIGSDNGSGSQGYLASAGRGSGKQSKSVGSKLPNKEEADIINVGYNQNFAETIDEWYYTKKDQHSEENNMGFGRNKVTSKIGKMIQGL
jgi:hypothetical protein